MRPRALSSSYLHAASAGYVREARGLGGRFVDTARDTFRLAVGVSACSLAALFAREAKPCIAAGGGGWIMTLSYIAAQRAVPATT